jgi:hypothetical protein
MRLWQPQSGGVAALVVGVSATTLLMSPPLVVASSGFGSIRVGSGRLVRSIGNTFARTRAFEDESGQQWVLTLR